MPTRALVVSASSTRYEHVASSLTELGLIVSHSPAVFVNATPQCRGFNGHRLAMRKAWRKIVAENESMAIFEDDVVPANTVDPTTLSVELNAYIAANSPTHDVLWLGGMGRFGRCFQPGKGARGVTDRCIPTKINGRPASNSLYTDHAKYITPRGARMLLACTGRCIEPVGWAIDSIVRHLCKPQQRRDLGSANWSMAVRTEHCEPQWVHEALNCKPPPEKYVRPYRDTMGSSSSSGGAQQARSAERSRTSPPSRGDARIFLGFFSQDRKQKSEHDRSRLKEQQASEARARAMYCGAHVCAPGEH